MRTRCLTAPHYRTSLLQGYVRKILLATWLIMAMAASATAQVTPLIMGTTSPILDEAGERLQGNSPTSPDFGHPYVPGDVIELMTANFGIYPPATNGAPHFSNLLLFTTRIGTGTSGSQTNPAQFAASVVPRPIGQAVFARVFNAPSIEAASFYCDSQIHLVGTDDNILFIVDVFQTEQPLDDNDDDGDGLNNSWEKSYGSDRHDPDSDDDGLTDYEEHLAGTHPTNDQSRLSFEQVVPSGADLILQWHSVAGKIYIVQVCTNLMETNATFGAFSPQVTATNSETTYVLTNASATGQSAYRLRLVTE